jgi:hypothetical protein
MERLKSRKILSAIQLSTHSKAEYARKTTFLYGFSKKKVGFRAISSLFSLIWLTN